MRKLWEKIEAAFTAAAFAEQGEVETARQILADDAGETPPREDARRPTAREGAHPSRHHRPRRAARS